VSHINGVKVIPRRKDDRAAIVNDRQREGHHHHASRLRLLGAGEQSVILQTDIGSRFGEAG
jgi:hypothetical protein